MDTLNYLEEVKDGQMRFADGTIQTIPHWGDRGWTHLFCVRHADKDDGDSHDHGLSAQGAARAEHLGRIMSKAGLDAVYSTSTHRTQLTAEPVQRRGDTPPVIIYEAGNQEEWLEELLPLNRGKKLLIVGHQNTIPHLLNLLKGTGFEFDNIPNYDFGKFYVVATKGIGETEVLELRY